MAPNLEHVKRAPYSSEEPRTGSVTSFNVIPPKQLLHGRCLGLPVRGYDSSCGNSNSPAPLTEYAHYCLTRKSKNSIRKRTFKSKGTRSWCAEMSDLSNDTKKHTTKSRETIPLNLVLFVVAVEHGSINVFCIFPLIELKPADYIRLMMTFSQL
jgi:hypothetical protein